MRDDFRIFEREWNQVRSETARSEGPLLHRRGYAHVAELGEALSGAGSLDEAQRNVVDGWRTTHEAELTLFGRVERYPRKVAALIEERGSLHHPEDPDMGDPARPEHRKWRSDCEALLAEGEAMLRSRRDTGRYLAASTAQFKRHLGAIRTLEHTLTDDACLAFEWLTVEVARAAGAARTLPFHTPRYAERAKWAESLASTAGLPEATRRQVSGWQARHDECPRRRAEIEMTRDGTGEAWRRDALALAHAGRAMLTGNPAWRPHLDAMAGPRNALPESVRTVHGLLELEGVLESADARFIVPCRGRVLKGDRTRSTVHGPPRTGYESRGEKMTIEGEVKAVVPMGRSGDDLVDVRTTACSIESGFEVGSAEWLTMRTLFGYGCARTMWENEEERARLEEIDRREIAERERRLDAARSRGQRRQLGRGEDYDLSP